MLQPPSPGSLVWFWLICSRREGSTAAVVTLDTAVDESRKSMVDYVTGFPARLCSRNGKLCYYGRLEHDFLAFLPCSLLLLFSPSLSRHVSLINSVPSSGHQSSATLQQVVRVLSSCVICILYHLRLPRFICLAYFLVGAFVVLSHVPGTSALDLPTLIHSRFCFFSFSLSVTT